MDDYPIDLSFLLKTYFTTFGVFTGVCFNIICIYVFRCFAKSNSAPVIHYYLVTLTIWQTGVLINAFLLYSFPTFYRYYASEVDKYQLIYPYAYFGANITNTASMWVVLALTIDRYLALCKPLSHRYIGKRARVKKLMIIVSILAIIFCIPRFLEIETNKYCENVNNDSICHYQVQRSRINVTFQIVYRIVSGLLFVTLVPCIILFILTLKISFALHTAIIRRNTLCQNFGEKTKKKSLPKEHKANIMLLLIISKFLISSILPTLNDIAERIIGEKAFVDSARATMIVDISNLLVVINCSTNFWVFLIYGKRFRQIFKRLVLRKLLVSSYFTVDTSVEALETTAINRPGTSTVNSNVLSRVHISNEFSEKRVSEENKRLLLSPPRTKVFKRSNSEKVSSSNSASITQPSPKVSTLRKLSNITQSIFSKHVPEEHV
uniref:G_PROTEIN_RECEP_F1_2 domain-containing protein n=1 Tax=Rhabditophanes sp. KR3021 TaxID=114890 RepID=A0AC35UD10_9BILA